MPSWTCKTVGGTTVHWTGATPRIRAWEVRARSTYGAIKGASLIDWPIEYAELEHYYQLAEKRMVVTRRNGNPGLPASNHFKVMYNGAKRIGYKHVHTNYMAINTRPADGRGLCIQQGFCVQGCKTGAKWSTLYTEIPRAEATGNLDLRVQCRALRIEHGAERTGDRRGVPRCPAGNEQRQKARDRVRGVQLRGNRAAAAAVRVRKVPARTGEFQRPGRAQLLPSHRRLRLGRSSTSRSSSGAARRSPGSSRMRPNTIRSAVSPAAITWSWRRWICRACRWRAAEHDVGTRVRLRPGPLSQHGRHVHQRRGHAARRRTASP